MPCVCSGSEPPSCGVAHGHCPPGFVQLFLAVAGEKHSLYSPSLQVAASGSGSSVERGHFLSL